MARGYPLRSKILDALQNLSDDIGYIFYRGPGHLSGMGRGREDFYALRHEYEERDKRRMLAQMKRQKLIASRKIGNRLEVKITDRGFQQLLIRTFQKAVDRSSGEEYCIVVFDIPETERDRRDLMRYIFRECGMQCLQKSVWVAPVAVLPILQAFVEREKLTPWIHIICGKIVTEKKPRKFKHPGKK